MQKENSLPGSVSPDELSGTDGSICTHWGLIIFCKDSPCFCTSLLPQTLVNLVLSVLLLYNFRSVTPMKGSPVA